MIHQSKINARNIVLNTNVSFKYYQSFIQSISEIFSTRKNLFSKTVSLIYKTMLEINITANLHRDGGRFQS